MEVACCCGHSRIFAHSLLYRCSNHITGGRDRVEKISSAYCDLAQLAAKPFAVLARQIKHSVMGFSQKQKEPPLELPFAYHDKKKQDDSNFFSSSCIKNQKFLF